MTLIGILAPIMARHELIRERYQTVEIVRSIETLPKSNLISLKVCNWKDCKYRTIIPCANHRCNKIACDKKHSCLICVECAKKKVETLSILQERRKCKQVMCKVFKHCKSLTQIRCGVYGCEKPVCDLHREKLCSDCCFNLKSQLNKKKYELCVMVL